MKRWPYFRMHLPLTCSCEQRIGTVHKETTQAEMTELEFYRWLSRMNYSGQGHWQYWGRP